MLRSHTRVKDIKQVRKREEIWPVRNGGISNVRGVFRWVVASDRKILA